MMKTRTQYLIVLLTLIIVTSCSKSDGRPLPLLILNIKRITLLPFTTQSIKNKRNIGGSRVHAGRLLQGPGQVGGHVRRDRRRALLDPRRLRHGRGRRHRRACSAAGASASTPAARRCTPRRSRRCSSATRRGRRRRRRRARRALRRGDHRARRARSAGTRIDEAALDRPRQGAPRRLQGAASASSRSTRSGGRPTASSTTRALQARARSFDG